MYCFTCTVLLSTHSCHSLLLFGGELEEDIGPGVVTGCHQEAVCQRDHGRDRVRGRSGLGRSNRRRRFGSYYYVYLQSALNGFSVEYEKVNARPSSQAIRERQCTVACIDSWQRHALDAPNCLSFCAYVGESRHELEFYYLVRQASMRRLSRSSRFLLVSVPVS
jgi:hypothetical protein